MKITINGKDYPLSFNNLAFETYSTKLNPDAIASTSPYAIVWGGLVEGAYRNEEVLELTFSQVCDYVDSIKKEPVLETIVKKFMDCTVVKDLIEQSKEKKDPAKKKK